MCLGAGPVAMKVLTGCSLVPSPRPPSSGRRWKLACVAARRLLAAPWSPVARPATPASSATAVARCWDGGRTETRTGRARNPAATRARTAGGFWKTHRRRNETRKWASVRAASRGRRFTPGWPNCTWATVKFAYVLIVFFLSPFKRLKRAIEMLSPLFTPRLHNTSFARYTFPLEFYRPNAGNNKNSRS